MCSESTGAGGVGVSMMTYLGGTPPPAGKLEQEVGEPPSGRVEHRDFNFRGKVLLDDLTFCDL